MTLGEKIKAARKNAGLTQEQLAEKLMVSRPAITKWETDKGMPDIENLKALSKLLNVSLDYLLDDGETPDLTIIREPIDPDAFKDGATWKAKDAAVRAAYPDAATAILGVEPILSTAEKVLDNVIGFFTDAPFGIPEAVHYVQMKDCKFYLVEKDGAQFLVTVDKEFMESRRLLAPVENRKRARFIIGELKFTNCGPLKPV